MPKVDSSAVESVEHDANRRELTVTFVSGARYAYCDVDEASYRELLAAESIGTFVNTAIKPNRRYRRLTDRPTHAPRSAA